MSFPSGWVPLKVHVSERESNLFEFSQRVHLNLNNAVVNTQPSTILTVQRYYKVFWRLRLLYFSVLYCTLVYFILRYFERNALDYSALTKIYYYSRGARAAVIYLLSGAVARVVSAVFISGLARWRLW